MLTKITKEEVENIIPTSFEIRQLSLEYDRWEVHFYFEYSYFVLFINCTPSTLNVDGVWYTAYLRIRGNSKFELNYGFSNYLNNYDYILRAISLDLNSFEKTGKFSKYVNGYHNMLTPDCL